MNTLIVYAHMERQSFNAAMLETANEVLAEAGHEVRVSDLYASGFNPVPGRHDFIGSADEDIFRMQPEQLRAAAGNTFAADIAAEQEKVKWANFIIFQFPLWWFGVPAILKGWFDRVFSIGFAYGHRERFDSGRLQGRRAILAMTAGAPAVRYTEGNVFGSLELVLYPIHVGILNFVGIEVMKPFVSWSIHRISLEERRCYLEAYRERLLGIEHERPLPFHSLDRFPDPLGETARGKES